MEHACYMHSTAWCCLCIIQMRKIIIRCNMMNTSPNILFGVVFILISIAVNWNAFSIYKSLRTWIQIPGLFQHAIGYIECIRFEVYPLISLSCNINMNRTWFVCLVLLFFCNFMIMLTFLNIQFSKSENKCYSGRMVVIDVQMDKKFLGLSLNSMWKHV